MEQNPNKRFINITKAVYTKYYDDLGIVEIMDDSTLEIIKISIIPFEGIHQECKYIITCKFQEICNWPLVFIDSDIYDKIKTNQYLQNKGRNGIHKGICIKNMGYGYNFNKNFKEICGDEWKNYIYNLIIVFNNIQDFEKGNGFKSNYKNILKI